MPFTIFPHMLRHACGYALANAGHDTRALQAWLGPSVSRSRHDASNSSARRLLVQPTLYYAHASAVLDHSITLPQGDRNARPTLARGEIGSERNLIVLDAGDVLNDGFAVRSPGINAEGEVSSRCGHGIRVARRGG
jgi:hypothetical protein